jgi:5'-3' exonuclease
VRVHLIDGTFELFRAHFSKRPDHQTPEGRPAKATVGVVASMLYLMQNRDEAVTHIAVAFDNPIESFRNEVFDGYKSGEGIPLELASQFNMVEEAMRAIGLVVWSMDRWEADDALATGAARFAPEVDQVRIMTPDKDLGQCISGQHIVQVDRMRKKVIDEVALRERRGIAPRSIPDFLALVGDTADGIPGLPRFGEKSSSLLLGRYGHIENIPRMARDWDVKVRGALSLAAVLEERREDALLYRHLATLVEDVPLKESIDDLEWYGVPRGPFLKWCERMGVSRLRDMPPRWRN